MYVPDASAVVVNHNVGKVDINWLTDFGRILWPIYWAGPQATNDPGTGFGFIGLVIDQDNYDHTPGSEDIADSFSNFPYASQGDLEKVNDITMIIDDGTTQKSIASFKNTGAGTGDPNDILINQTVWTVKNKDWAILQWTLNNLKGVDLTGVCIGLELSLSQAGAGGGVSGDSGDDIDGFDAGNGIYYVQDDDGTTFGFSSAVISNPITHYFSEDYHPADYDTYKVFWEDDAWLYERLHAPNAVEGTAPGNRTSTVGWNGVTMPAGTSRNFTLVFAINDTLNNMIKAVEDARHFYKYVARGFRITEFSDSGLGSPQNPQIELYNFGFPMTDLVTEGYFFSVDGGATSLNGNWISNNPLPTFEHAVFEVTGGIIGAEGATIGLYHPIDGLIDEVLFGQEGIAPDPLDGESAARRFDAASATYLDEWLRNTSYGPTWGAQNDVPAVYSNSIVKLNAVMFYPSTPNGKYIELMYTGTVGIDISNYTIVSDDKFVVPSGTTLNSANRFYVLIQSEFPALFSDLDSGGDNVYLYDNKGRLLDMVGWSSPHAQGMNMRRVPDGNGTNQGYNDLTSEAAGWVFNRPPHVLITEISDSESAVAQIEIYNPSYPPIDFNAGFTFESASLGAISGVWSIPTADRYEYALFNVITPNSLDVEGDTVNLYQKGILIEEISYGQKGTVPDPLPNESVERIFGQGYYTDVWSRNGTSGPNFGTQNDVPSPNFISLSILNEIMFNPIAPEDKFVELYIRGYWLDISGYKIVGDSEYSIPQGTKLSAMNRFFYLTFTKDKNFFDALDPSGDNVYLYDDNGALLDMAGWNSLHKQGKTMCRVPDGTGTRDGFNDTSSIRAGWIFNCIPTVQLIKVSTLQHTKYGNYSGVIYFNLNITNKQDVNDTVLIFNSTLYGYPVTILDETGSFIISEIFVPAQSYVYITVMVILDSTYIHPPMGWDNITITIQSKNNTLIRDSTILRVVAYAFIWQDKYAFPHEIYLNGTGNDEISTINLNLMGMGSTVVTIQPQDVIFCVDTSGSMSRYDVGLAKMGLLFYVDKMGIPDQGAVVYFTTFAELMNPLTDNYTQLKEDIRAIPDPSGGTNIALALQVAIDELLSNGTSGHIQVIILLTDGGNNAGSDPVLDMADLAATNNITIFTIGLGNGVDEATLKEVANITGGQYFFVDDSLQLPEIYMVISAYLGDVAGRDVDIYDAEPMVRDVLPPWIELVNGSFSKTPDVNYVNETGYRILEWNISVIKIGEVWDVTFQVKSNEVRWVRANDLNTSRIYYVDYFDYEILKLFPECLLHVLAPPLQEPILYINTSQDGKDAILNWDPPSTPGIDHYLIYRSTSQTAFDFNTIWKNTSVDKEPGESSPIPLRTMWNDSKAAVPGDLNYEEQYYYVIRAVSKVGEISRTSRTVGKWTKTFSQGISTFSLPLEPLETMNKSVDYYLKDMSAGYIKWMHPVSHRWMKHGDGGVNDTQMKVGEGYEVKFDSQTTYTFTGMPGAMISYDDDNGFLGFDSDSEARNLTVSVEQNGDVNLTWLEPASMSDGWYEVYYSNERDGFFKTPGVNYFLVCPPIYFGNNMATHDGAKANDPGARLYYMVVPFNAMGVRGASTYSIGIWTEEYLSQYDTIGIPLKLTNNHTADWYCDNIPDTVGINYFIYTEQRWRWHSTRMPGGAYDPLLVMTEGYQISTSQATKFTFIGV